MKVFLYKILAYILRRRLVVLIDHDREESLRLAYRNKHGLFAKRLSFKECQLLPDNKTKGVPYVVAWYYFRG